MRKRLATDGLYPPGGGGGGGDDDGDLNDINAGGMTETSVVAAASMLMSRQLRGSCEESLLSFAAFFQRFANPAASGDSAFKLQLKLNDEYKPGSDSPLVVIEPSMERLQQMVCTCIDQIVRATQKFPRVESGLDADGAEGGGGAGGAAPAPPAPDAGFSRAFMLKASQYLGPCTLALDDEMVLRVKQVVQEEIKRHWEKPSNLVDEYNLFAPLASGQIESQVTDMLMQCQGGAETMQDLDNLHGLCEDLQAMVATIRDVTPDLCFYPMFMVNCFDAKQVLKKKAEGLRAQIVEHVSTANHVHMTDMCREYQDLANRLVEEPADSAELKSLQE